MTSSSNLGIGCILMCQEVKESLGFTWAVPEMNRAIRVVSVSIRVITGVERDTIREVV